MELFKVFKNLLGKKDTPNETPEGYCPQCWGRQEYGGKFYDAVYKEQINLNNIDSKKGWINAYVTKNLEGIKLKDAEGVRECSSCNITYKQSI